MKKKKVVIAIIFILFLLTSICVIMYTNINKTKHIYDKDGHIRDFTLITSEKAIYQSLKSIYGELPYDDNNGNIYEYIDNFDGIETCSATVIYSISKKYKTIDDVYINLNSTKYSSNELYDIVIKNLESVYGDQPLYTDKRGEIVYSSDGKPETLPWYTKCGFIHVYKDKENSCDGNVYQVVIDFVY